MLVVDDDMSLLARSFERGAGAYERWRPEFPAALFDDVAEIAGSRLSGRVLEIGAGTGRATLPLLARGASVDVVEPSADMLAVLSGRLAAAGLDGRCRLRRATFEDVDPSAVYDVVVAAQSFHWADPTTRWSRLASLLRGGGHGFLFWNGWLLDGAAHDLDAVRQLYAVRGQGLAADVDDHRAQTAWAESEIEAVQGLALAEARTYAWDRRLPVDGYLGLLRTVSQYAVADAAVREPLLASLREVLGGEVALRGATRLLHVVPGGSGRL